MNSKDKDILVAALVELRECFEQEHDNGNIVTASNLVPDLTRMGNRLREVIRDPRPDNSGTDADSQ
jgi:hypothetical protein